MDVRLEKDLEDFVQELVTTGRFSDADAVVSAAIRQMKDKSAKKAEIRRMMLEEASTDPVHLIG